MTEQVSERVSARELFRAAYENRYTWDSNFPGYTMDVTFRDGDKEYTAKARVNPNLSADVTEIDDEEAQKAIQNQLWEIAIHRVRRSFEDTHSKNEFAYGSTDPDGSIEILIGGKSSGDRYKLRNNEVSHVHRHIHGVVVTIDTFSSHDTGEGYLSHRYDSVYHDPKTGEQKGARQLFEDNYEQIGNYWILTNRRIETEADGKPVTIEFAFSNIKLLQPAMV